ncbi:hypothetical protein FPY71_08015 [Aureimonas fodinaquatilis]|uniref:Uncharacterized protein n=1 Tax=Aureimonas fodinaquatilis TaxID=2565783 RepID=A0A5B0DZ30_9HYPH|nr:hypothetical protein [Aureimonas fodinaquatilis]KAA0970449.1 hypothetical protein FPY71_08015 [Aureimonas fodinaquatilis]
MTCVVLVDGRVFHLPGAPYVTDSTSEIIAPPDAELTALVPLIPDADLLLLIRRLVMGVHRRRFDSRWKVVNRSRLKLARLCIDRALSA